MTKCLSQVFVRACGINDLYLCTCGYTGNLPEID